MRFPFFGVPVSVHWSFLIVAFFGLNRYDSIPQVAGWTVAVFAAVLFHEAGHAFTAKAFGATQISITLFALGGLTTWVPRRDMGPGKRFVVSAAGSAVGIALGLGILFLARQGLLDGLPDWAHAFFETFILAGLLWGVLNWIPMLPLDGGHMLEHGLALIVPRYAERATLVITVVVGVALVIGAFAIQETFLGIFLIFLLVSGVRSLPGTPRQSTPPPPQPLPTQEAPDQGRDQEPPAFPI
jgi:Zn-dependent protease